jgi:Transposase domain (DUF772)
MRHELVQLAGKIDWDFIDGEIAPLYSDSGRPGIATRFVIGLFLLKHISGLSDEGVCERWVYDPYFQHFTGEEFFQHAFPHERSDLSHWRNAASLTSAVCATALCFTSLSRISDESRRSHTIRDQRHESATVDQSRPRHRSDRTAPGDTA